MKRIIALLLCMVLMCSAMVISTSAETTFNSYTRFPTALFLISGSNTAGQEFVPGFTGLKGIKAYLNNEVANNPVTVTVYQGTPKDGTKIHTEQLSLADVSQGWFTMNFSQSLTVSADVMYSFTLHTDNRAVWFGETVDGDYKAWNYDEGAYGGWIRGNIAAFELVADYTGVTQPYEGVVALIDALPAAITLQHEQQVADAYAAYSALTTDQKALVSNLNKLTAAQATIDELNERLENADRYAIEEAIEALGEITAESADALENIDKLIYAYAYEKGIAAAEKIANYDDYLAAVETYNGLEAEAIPYGDPNASESVDATDALMVLQQAVNKLQMTDEQKLVSDVNADQAIDAKDALLILQYAVKKIDKFPADQGAEPIEPISHTLPLYSMKNESLFAKTYQSMIDRTQSNGYAQTSLNGSYVGMFGRDSSIQIMSHIAEGDYDHAAKIMTYLIEYHEKYNADYVLHIMLNDAAPYSNKVQTDSTFFFLHAWYLYATKAPESETKTTFLAASEDKVKKFADYFMDEFYFNQELGLVENPHLEHSKEGREWYTFDLLTNVYASQVWHELSLYFAHKDAAKAKAWGDAAQTVAEGVHKHLVSEIDGKQFYVELIDLDQVTNVNEAGLSAGLEKGFSWVNLSPISCDWYAMNDELMENTYQLYMKYGSVNYYGKYRMLEVHTAYTGSTNVRGNHVIGKGLAWEMMYCKKMGYTDRLRTLVSFVEEYSEDMYRETWVYSGGGSDTANQEHASWMLIAHKTCFPELAAETQEVIDQIRVGTYNIHILSEVNRNAATIAKDITDAGLDIVGIQEVDQNTNRTGKVDQAKALAEELGWYYSYSKAIDLEDGAYGHAILSKYPIDSYTTFQLPSGTEEQRVCGHAVIRVGDRTVNVLNAHLTWTGLQGGQFQEIADYIADFDNFIITGDFNCTDFSAYNVLGGNLVNNAADTFVTNSTDGAIDNIVVSKNYTVGKGVMVATGHSDHNMLYADITIG